MGPQHSPPGAPCGPAAKTPGPASLGVHLSGRRGRSRTTTLSDDSQTESRLRGPPPPERQGPPPGDPQTSSSSKTSRPRSCRQVTRNVHTLGTLTETLRRNLASRQVSVAPVLFNPPHGSGRSIAHFLCGGGSAIGTWWATNTTALCRSLGPRAGVG